MAEASGFAAQILTADDERETLAALRADPRVEFLDHSDELLRGVRALHPTPGSDILDEPIRWVYYPWRRTVVATLGPKGFRTLRLDRNRHLITTAEQERLAGLRIAVAGLSVGHVIAHTLAAEGLCGAIRVADFDTLELSNLNRVPATTLDIGLNKAVITARRIAELDPYIRLEVMTSGVTSESLDDFLDGVDIVVEECDSLDVKLLIREAARARRLPVLMATSDRGLIDVERFDLDPQRPVMHGLLGDVDSTHLASLPNRDRIPHMLRHLDASRSSARLTASLVEMNHTLSTWPQLAGEVVIGASAIAEAVRRIGLGQPLASGQTHVDVGRALDRIGEPSAVGAAPVPPADHNHHPGDPAAPADCVTTIAEAAIRAPSGGNAQPWTIETHADSLRIRMATQYTSMMDVAFRGSAVALGAAAFNARVAAAALGVLGPVEWSVDGPSPLEATLRLGHEVDPEMAALYQGVLSRETSRHHGTPQPIDPASIDTLVEWARREGARLHLVTSRQDIDDIARICAAADRIRFLTPRLHQEMIAELRWPGDQPADTGIDVHSLELDPGGLAVLEILRRPDVMALLARWNAGRALGDDVHDRVRAASAVGVVTVRGHELVDFARGGSAVQAVWVLARAHGLAVHPVSPVFLHAVHRDELAELSPVFAGALESLQTDFRRLARTDPDEFQVLILRLAHARPGSIRSRRRPLAPPVR
jgi:molybdopterin/thiamine biosynthesis adenylyltransferase